MANAPVPPQNLEAEESVLGAVMLGTHVLDNVVEFVSPSDFYRESHGKIFAAATAIHAEGLPIDAITLAEALDRSGELASVGGKARIHELASLVPATANAVHYAKIVREKSIQRGLIHTGQNIARLGFEAQDPLEALEEAQQQVFELSRDRSQRGIETIGHDIREEYERLVRLHEEGRSVTGLETGYHQLDLMTAGFQPGNLVVLAARPSMGKTAVGLSFLAHNAIHKKVPGLLFTLEMSRSEVRQRLLSLEAYVDLHALRTGRLDADDWAKVGHAIAKLEHAPLYVDDQGDLTMVELRARARRHKLKHESLGLIVVDYLQLMVSGIKADSRVLEVGQISRALKVLARELEIPVVAVSQLSRRVEERHDKRPMLSDLRESGNIEQDADLVVFLYRDEYYNPEDPDVEGLAELNIAKHRNGPTGNVKLTFVKRHARFSDPPLSGDMTVPA